MRLEQGESEHVQGLAGSFGIHSAGHRQRMQLYFGTEACEALVLCSKRRLKINFQHRQVCADVS